MLCWSLHAGRSVGVEEKEIHITLSWGGSVLGKKKKITIELVAKVDGINSHTHTHFTMSSTVVDRIGEHRPGSIKRMKLHNFLTHGDVEFWPGPR